MGFSKILKAIFVVGPAVVAALPAPVIADLPASDYPAKSRLAARQAAAAGGLTDTDILQLYV